MRTFLPAAILASTLSLFGCGGAATPAPQPPAPLPVSAPSATADTTPSPSADTPPPASPPRPAMSDLIASALKSWSDALNAHDPQKYAALYAPDGIRRTIGEPDQVGRDAIARGMQGVFASLPDYKFAIRQVLEKGNVAIVLAAFAGTDTVGGEGSRPTGRPVGMDVASVFTFGDDGLIKELHLYADRGTVEAQKDPKAKAGTFRAPPTLPASYDVVMAGGPNEDANLQSTRMFYQAFGDHKVDALMAFVSDDAIIDDNRHPPTKGSRTFRQGVEATFVAIPDFGGSYPGQWAIGDYVVSEAVVTGTFKGKLGPFKPTGKPVSLRFIDILLWKGAKMTLVQDFTDGQDEAAQFGMTKPSKPAR